MFPRITFIYNLCFLVTLILRYFDFIPDKELKSMVIVSGSILSLICNVVLIGWICVVLLRKKSRQALHPRWIFAANVICFIFQIYFFAR